MEAVTMSLALCQAFSVTEIDIILNGIPVQVNVELRDTMLDNRIHVEGVVPIRSMLKKLEFTCKKDGERLTVEITAGGQSKSVKVKNTGDAIVVGSGVANTGVQLSSASSPSGRFEKTKQSGVIRHVTKPHAILNIATGTGGLRYRIS